MDSPSCLEIERNILNFRLVQSLISLLYSHTLSSPSRILLLMGVAGSGKTTIGRMVATSLDWPYFEADDFHSAENIQKMAGGIPLNDTDREPWLAAIKAKIDECQAKGQSAIFTCSALKDKYRTRLGVGSPTIVLVYLKADFETIIARVGQRQGHYMKAEMVRSQFETIEPPKDAFTIDVKRPPDQIAQAIVHHLKAPKCATSAVQPMV